MTSDYNKRLDETLIQETSELLDEKGPLGTHEVAELLNEERGIVTDIRGEIYDIPHAYLEAVLVDSEQFVTDDTGRFHRVLGD